jgi:pimeloyl-ACP methyl ester carboxylesterase
MMGALALFNGCGGPPAPAATSEQKSAIPRFHYAAPPPATYRISYLRGGDPRGRRIIFVHGTPGSADGWVDYLTDVPAGFDHIAVDRPGFGQSGPDGAVVSLAEQARALEPLLVNQGGDWPVLVGHSLGGPIVAWLAATYPERVGALVILAGSLDPALERIHWAQPVGEWPGIRSVLPRAMRNANRELMALKPELEALQPMLSRIACPVVIVHGTEDQLVPYANVPFMQAQMRGAALTVDRIEGQNHFLPWNEQGRVRRAIALAASAGDGTC